MPCSFPLATTVALLGWGVLDFQGGYAKAGQLQHARDGLRYAADYL